MVLFSFSHGKAEKGMKRESGVSPEQSRCCELYFFCFVKYLIVTVCNRWEDGQSWSKSEDLQNLTEEATMLRGWLLLYFILAIFTDYVEVNP